MSATALMVLAQRGAVDLVDGIDHVHKVVNIDQTPIGRNRRSNPATFIGFYDNIRDLYTQAPLSVERDYKAGPTSRADGARSARAKGSSPRTSTSCPTWT